MTSLLGIKAYADSKNRKVILASDTQVNDEETDPPTRTVGFNKIVAGSYWAMGFTGTVCPPLRTFCRALKQASNEGTVEKAVRNHYFPEVNQLNRKICRKSGDEDLAAFLLATAKPETGLFYVDIMGNVLKYPPNDDETQDYITLGSGKKFMKTFLEERIGNKSVDQEGLTADVAIRIAYDAIEKSEDPNTGGGVELFMITQKGVHNYGERLRKAIKKALRDELEIILKEQSA